MTKELKDFIKQVVSHTNPEYNELHIRSAIGGLMVQIGCKNVIITNANKDLLFEYINILLSNDIESLNKKIYEKQQVVRMQETVPCYND